MNTALSYPTITARAEQAIRGYLDLAAAHHGAEHLTGKCVARGGALGVLSMWVALVTELDALNERDYHADRARLLALMN